MEIEPKLLLFQNLRLLRSHRDPTRKLFVMFQQTYDDEPVTFFLHGRIEFRSSFVPPDPSSNVERKIRDERLSLISIVIYDMYR